MGTYEVVIRESHLDTFGHVNNAVYLELFEEARWEMATRNGWGLEKVKETGLGPVILEANIKFRKEVKLRSRVTIETHCQDYRRLIGHLQQRMIDERGEECAVATFTFGLFDLKRRKLVPPTEEWKRAIGVNAVDSVSKR